MVTLADFALQLNNTLPPIASVTFHVKEMKYGIQSSEPVVADQVTLSLIILVVCAMVYMKPITTKLSAVTVLVATRKLMVLVALVHVDLSVLQMRTG